MDFELPYGFGGQQQRQRPQEKKPYLDPKTPSIEQIEIESVDDLLEELEQIKKKEQSRCGCWATE